MQNLQELVYIVTKNKIKSIETLDSSSSSRALELYDGIAKGRFKTDDEAASYFFDAKAKYKNYNKLKNSLKRKLLNSIFFIDTKKSSYSDRQSAYQECQKEWAAANILFAKNAISSAVEIAIQVLKYSKKFEFTELVIEVSRRLSLYFATKKGSQKKYEYYLSLQLEYEPILSAEKKVEKLYSDLIINYVNNKSTKKEISAAALTAYQEIADSLQKYTSYNLHLYGVLIRLMIHTGVNDYENALNVCDDIISVFENKNYQASTPLNIAYYQQLVCYTQIREYEKGRIAAQNCISRILPGSFNWFKYHELYLVLLLHTERYDETYSLLRLVTKHKRFNFLPENIKEIWRIFEAYLLYLNSVGVNISDAGEAPITKFKLAKFMNETPIFSKDKAGLNISILIVQILFLIAKKDYDKLIDKTEAIDKYCSRYLKKDTTIRSYYFIKMLISGPAASFNKEDIITKVKTYYDGLKNHPFEVSNQGHNIEIVPYETLWKYVLDSF